MPFQIQNPPKPGHDVLGRKIPPYHFAEHRLGKTRFDDDVNVMHVFSVEGEITVAHRRVKVGDHVYYFISDHDVIAPGHNGPIHAYAKIEDFRDGEVAYVTGYSEVADHGEYGSVYVDQFRARLTEKQFNRARKMGWPDIQKIINSGP